MKILFQTSPSIIYMVSRWYIATYCKLFDLLAEILPLDNGTDFIVTEKVWKGCLVFCGYICGWAWHCNAEHIIFHQLKLKALANYNCNCKKELFSIHTTTAFSLLQHIDGERFWRQLFCICGLDCRVLGPLHVVKLEERLGIIHNIG